MAINTRGRSFFDTFLSTELPYHGLRNDGTIAEKRQRLQTALEVEAMYGLMTKLVLPTDYDSAFYAVEDAISCIMHGGNRMGEKIFMMMLLEFWAKCKTNSKREELIATVENFINRGIFGTKQSRSQWKLPINEESKLETVSFSAWRVKKIMAKLSELGEILFHDMDITCLKEWCGIEV